MARINKINGYLNWQLWLYFAIREIYINWHHNNKIDYLNFLMQQKFKNEWFVGVRYPSSPLPTTL